VANLLKKRFDIPPAVGVAILMTCLAVLILELGFEDSAAFLMLPAALFLPALMPVLAASTKVPVLNNLSSTLIYGLPVLGWWLVVRIVIAGWRRWRGGESGAGA
jgi:hypothetical protein